MWELPLFSFWGQTPIACLSMLPNAQQISEEYSIRPGREPAVACNLEGRDHMLPQRSPIRVSRTLDRSQRRFVQ